MTEAKRVYVLLKYWSDIDECAILGVYSTREEAEKVENQTKRNSSCEVVETNYYCKDSSNNTECLDISDLRSLQEQVLNILNNLNNLVYKNDTEGCTTVSGFNVGDAVEKYTGDYTMPGIIVSLFKTSRGHDRVVVEHEPGFLHIYNTTQIRKIKND